MQDATNKNNNSTQNSGGQRNNSGNQNQTDIGTNNNSGGQGTANNPAGNPVSKESVDMVNQGSTPTQGGGNQESNENKVAGDKSY